MRACPWLFGECVSMAALACWMHAQPSWWLAGMLPDARTPVGAALGLAALVSAVATVELGAAAVVRVVDGLRRRLSRPPRKPIALRLHGQPRRAAGRPLRGSPFA
jgi:hypothetical protein